MEMKIDNNILQIDDSKIIDYNRKIITKASPQESYDFLTNRIGNWWTLPNGNANAIGDEPTFKFAEGFWTMKVIDLVENNLVKWKCIEANHLPPKLLPKDANEWEGTELEFVIEPHENGSQISFTHYGLNQSLNCFDICEAGWNHFFVKVLLSKLNNLTNHP